MSCRKQCEIRIILSLHHYSSYRIYLTFSSLSHTHTKWIFYRVLWFYLGGYFFFKGLLVNKRGCNFNFRDCCNPSSLSSDNLNANCHATLINLSAPAFYLAYYELFLVQIFLHAKMSYLAWSLFVLSCFFSLPTFSIVSIFSSFLLLMTLSKNAVLFWWN